MDDITIPVAEMPKPLHAGSLGRRNPFIALGDSTNSSSSTSASSGSKPLTRSPSRPISGATTATDTTVKAKGKAVNRAHQPQDVRPPTPEHRVHVQTDVLGKQKKTNIFSVSIQSPRRLSSRETARAHGVASPIPTDQPAASRSMWSGRFRSGSGSSTGAHSSKSTVGDPSTSREAPPPPIPAKPTASTSSSVKVSRPTIIASASRPPRQDTITTLNSPPPPYERNQFQYSESEADEHAGRCSPLCGLPSPRLTPVSEKGKERERIRDAVARPRDAERAREAERTREAERLREAERERERAREAERQKVRAEREKLKERERTRELERQRDKERTRGSRDRHGADAARERERRKGKDREVEITQPRRVGSPVVREKGRESQLAAAAVQVTAAPMEKVASGSGSGNSNSKRSKESVTSTPKVKRTKHGSFDFERPVSGAMNMRMALRGLGVGLGGHSTQPMERTLSKEGVPRSQGVSHKHSSLQPTSHGRLRSSKRPAVDVTAATLGRQPTENTQSTNPQSATHSHFNYSDFDPVSPHSSHSGQSSSLGRSAGNRMLRGVHPAFKFEPAVPPIPGSPAGDEHGAHSRDLNHRSEPSPLGRASSMTKGRSLDLGLSLSWAPQRVREEAVLSYTQNGRQPATTSRLRARWRAGTVDEHGRLDVATPGSASSVATAFKEALGDAAYGTFKTCRSSLPIAFCPFA